jgi:hypothetical protein
VLAEALAVVGGEDHQRVLEQAQLLELAHHGGDCPVDDQDVGVVLRDVEAQPGMVADLRPSPLVKSTGVESLAAARKGRDSRIPAAADTGCGSQ